jgi:hypothetical protein
MKASNAVLQNNFPRQTEEITKIFNKYSLATNRELNPGAPECKERLIIQFVFFIKHSLFPQNHSHPASVMSAAMFNVKDFILPHFLVFKSCLPYYVSPLFRDILK